MKRADASRFFLLLIVIIALSACGPQILSPEAPTQTVSILGRLRPWRAGTPISGRRVTLCRSQGDPRDGLCTLLEGAVTTDRQGRFQMYDVPAGTYFVLYDSGLSDFDAAMAKWGGKELHFGDREWLADFLGVASSDNGLEYRVPEGISLSPHAGWLSSYCLLTLLVGESPFIIAHDLESASHERELHCALIDVAPGQMTRVDVQVLYFGSQ